jgi:hypothetical protein
MTLPKSSALGSLSEVVKSSREAADNHFKQLHSFQRFADMLVRLIRKQAPDLLPAIRYVVAPFTTAINHENSLVTAETRTADDLHDLSARYEVLVRQWSEYTDINKRLKDTRDKIARLRRELDEEERKGGPKQYKLKNDITVALDVKGRAVLDGQAKLEEILRSREKYYAFSARRLKHAYVNLGGVLAVESRAIVASFREMQGRINELRENIDAILDGTYALPEVGAVPSIAADEEEEALDGADSPPPRAAGEEEDTGERAPLAWKSPVPAAVPREEEEAGEAKASSPVIEAADTLEPAPAPVESTPYEPAPYTPDDDECPFAHE